MGTLFVVATPIGNLSDISGRASEILANVDLVAAEDTRHTRKLLAHLGLDKRVVSYHDHNESDSAKGLMAELGRGLDVALVSDAGTPLISDPGYEIVQQARRAGVPVIAIPGPSAVVTALSVCGLAVDRFMFIGFLPRRGRVSELQKLSGVNCTLVFYEAPNRAATLLSEVKEVLGAARQVVVARELTKVHEQVVAGTADELLASIDNGTITPRGEFVVIVEGAPVSTDEDEIDRLLGILLVELSVKQASELTAQITGAPRNSIYKRALVLDQST